MSKEAYRLDAETSGRDSHGVLDASLKSEVEELTFIGKVRDVVVRSNKQPDHPLLAKPFIVNLGPVLLCELNAWDFGQLLSCIAVLRTCESENSVRRQLCALNKLGECLSNTSASVAGCANDEYGRGHCVVMEELLGPRWCYDRLQEAFSLHL
jgi:hypothetical protein